MKLLDRKRGVSFISQVFEMLSFPGGYREGATPVPIPNTEVKPFIADGTARDLVWESRTLPGLAII